MCVKISSGGFWRKPMVKKVLQRLEEHWDEVLHDNVNTRSVQAQNFKQCFKDLRSIKGRVILHKLNVDLVVA